MNDGKSKILIVDDISANVDVLRAILERKGYQICMAPSGEIALKILPEIEPDLVLLGVTMPEMDGFEVCQKMKENPDLADIPVIFVTGKVATEDIVRGFNVGGSDYVSKPFQYEEILARVSSQIKIRELIQEKEALIKELDSLSRIDPLTKLSNRRDVKEILSYEQSRFERSGKGFTIGLGDIDFFKKINDQYGHDVGDYVLKEVAVVLKKNIRKVDSVARWGGEEFLIVLPDTTLNGAAKVIEKIRSSIESFNFEFNQEKIKVTMSFGVACHANECNQMESIIKLADDLLYKAKEQGRNRVITM